MNRILLFEHVSFLKNRTYATKNQYHQLSAYNGLSKEEVDQVIAKAERAGAKIGKRPQDVFWGGYFEDPEGYYWEVAWNPGFYPGPKSEN
ncbi:glyoxalase-like domain protein [Leptospira weilii str. 2006001853]|uniref:Glyoxalase-like domain protein n=1 Tax=Leptospira weilii str. 2006001853 TaxID=1001589 RepID=A0A828Z6D4_9LEPT|nr:glyoxalase-like domain protein [Leptospira weilii str. 2006001853]EMN43989.1 glyoxalase-like domain protein [Leptospira weilii str. LNT 1234]